MEALPEIAIECLGACGRVIWWHSFRRLFLGDSLGGVTPDLAQHTVSPWAHRLF